jgi:hypothetical protein
MLITGHIRVRVGVVAEVLARYMFVNHESGVIVSMDHLSSEVSEILTLKDTWFGTGMIFAVDKYRSYFWLIFLAYLSSC